MALEKDVDCPACDETRSFYRTAAMTLHLGEKTKWRCPDCGYGSESLGRRRVRHAGEQKLGE